MKTLITIVVIAFSTQSFSDEWDIARDIIKDWSKPHYNGNYIVRPPTIDYNDQYKYMDAYKTQPDCYVTRDAWGRQILKCQ